MTTFMTAGLPSEERTRRWADALSSLAGTLHTDTFGAETFDGQIEYGTIGHLKLCRIEASRHRVALSEDLARNEQHPVIKVILQLDGHSVYEQAGERLVVSPGDCLAYDVSHPHVKTIPLWSRHLVVVIPKEMALRHGFVFSTISAQRFSARQGAGRNAYEIVTSAFDEMPTITSVREAELAQTILNLLHLPLSRNAVGQSEHSGLAYFARQVKEHIYRNLRDPELCLEQIAAAFRCSKRYLHMSFAVEDTTIADYIWMARVEQCLIELVQPQYRSQTLTDIAFSWGFSSSSHFSHVFKRRFGCPPSSLLRGQRRIQPS